MPGGTPTPTGTLPEASRPTSGRSQDDAEPVGRRAARKKAAHALVHEMLVQGHSRRAIARHLGWGLNTVLRYANAARWQDTIRENRPRPSRLDNTQVTLQVEYRGRFSAPGIADSHNTVIDC
ncbi:helix-turn-helix domain-containing protein [Streptomyces griseofuscus]|uniref:helix-turn-helix domain-containing protein n=1 Tax=Streptomyces griseofuscus TaxID=146922 RepID=UPI0037ADD182